MRAPHQTGKTRACEFLEHTTDPSSSSPPSLVATWRRRAVDLRQWASADGAARAYELAADELEAALRTTASELLSVQEGARESGYSEEHLRRLLRMTPQLNRGRPGKPLIRRADLPRRAIARDTGVAYDPSADAR